MRNDREKRIAALTAYYEQLPPDRAMAGFAENIIRYRSDDHSETLEYLPEHNPAFAAAVYAAFAESIDPIERNRIVMYVPNLCRVDHDAGVTLWDHLMRDPNPNVRRTALDELSYYLGDPKPYPHPPNQEAEEEELDSIGLTWRDVAYLSLAYVTALHDASLRYQSGDHTAHDDQATE